MEEMAVNQFIHPTSGWRIPTESANNRACQLADQALHKILKCMLVQSCREEHVDGTFDFSSLKLSPAEKAFSQKHHLTTFALNLLKIYPESLRLLDVTKIGRILSAIDGLGNSMEGQEKCSSGKSVVARVEELYASLKTERSSDYMQIEDTETNLFYRNESVKTISLKGLALIPWSVIHGFIVNIALNLLIIPRVIHSLVHRKGGVETARLIAVDLIHALKETILLPLKVFAAAMTAIGGLVGNPYLGRALYALLEKGSWKRLDADETLIAEGFTLAAPCFQPSAKRGSNGSIVSIKHKINHLLGGDSFGHDAW